MWLWYLLCLILVFWSKEVTGGSCPALYQRYSNRHTFCLPRKESCNIIKNKVSENDIAFILNEHNTMRSKVATPGIENQLPIASDMMQMVWDDELADLAQKHSDQCVFKHDCNDCRRIKNFPEVGQNLFARTMSSSSKMVPKPDWNSAISNWFSESKKLDPTILSNYQENDGQFSTRHFTQLVWAKTWRIGCGYTLYKVGEEYEELYSCNYGPGANSFGDSVYQTCDHCSKCPINSCYGKTCGNQIYSEHFPGLCRIVDSNGPQYAPPTDFIFSCSFNGEPDCARVITSSDKNTWEVSHTLSDSYIGIVLRGGEWGLLNFTTPIKGGTHRCFTVYFRKGPNVADQEANNSCFVWFALQKPNLHYIKVNLKSNSNQFMKYQKQMNWNYDTQLAFRFVVPPWRPAQYLELTNLSVKNGRC